MLLKPPNTYANQSFSPSRMNYRLLKPHKTLTKPLSLEELAAMSEENDGMGSPFVEEDSNAHCGTD